MEKGNQMIEYRAPYSLYVKKQRKPKIVPFVLLISIIVSIISVYIIYKNQKELREIEQANTIQILKENESQGQENKQIQKQEEKLLEKQEEKKENEAESTGEAIIHEIKNLPKPNPNAQQVIGDIYASKEKVAYLTFDDGPSRNITPQVLDILKEEKIPATFFVLGSRVDANPDILKRIYDEGHYIANHSYTHVYKSVYENPEATMDEFNKTETSIKNAIGQNYNTYLFRFPGGSWGGYYNGVKKEAIKMFNEKGIAHTNWNVLTNDAAGATTVDKQMIEFEKGIKSNKGGLIILQHDARDKEATPETLRMMIARLKAEGYVFKNFYEIFK